MGNRIEIHPDNPQERFIRQVAACLEGGGVVIYPTDTVYAIGCDLMQKKALEKVCRIKGIKPETSQLSFICQDFKQIAEYVLPIDNNVHRMMKRVLPGPYTFILPADKKIPKHFQSRRKTIGVRMTTNAIAAAIVAYLGRPILSTSLHDADGVYEYDPDEIFERYGNQVDMFVDGGWGGSEPSTVVDCSQGDGEFVILREGLGPVELL
jgi:tRNA threonylcarbamoyl adenosine modification protein (Sua5/YciO/YrdC/YwlC family)